MTEEELLAHLSVMGFMHVADRIVLTKDQPEARAYFDELLIDNRHQRDGFPPEVFAIIMKLFKMQNFKDRALDTKGK